MKIIELSITRHHENMLQKIHQASYRLNMNLHDADVLNKAIEYGLYEFSCNLEKMINEENKCMEYLS